MTVLNKRNDESRANWLHMLTPFLGKYVVLGDITSLLDTSSSTVTANILDLKDQGLITEKRFNIRRFIELTPKGEELRAKYDAPPMLINPFNRSIKQDAPAVAAAKEIVEPKLTTPNSNVAVSNKSKFMDMHHKELEYVNAFMCSMVDMLDALEPVLKAGTMQLNSSATMFRRALEVDQQEVQLALNRKLAKHKKKQAHTDRGY